MDVQKLLAKGSWWICCWWSWMLNCWSSPRPEALKKWWSPNARPEYSCHLFPECQSCWDGLILNEKPLVVSWWSRKPPYKILSQNDRENNHKSQSNWLQKQNEENNLLKSIAKANPTHCSNRINRRKEPEVASFVQCEREHEDEHAALIKRRISFHNRDPQFKGFWYLSLALALNFGNCCWFCRGCTTISKNTTCTFY